jgi:putative ABC transport system ATP-binding protein
MSILSIKNIVHQYLDGKTIIFQDFTLQEHSTTLILGESGSGKSTLLHLLGGLMKPTQGAITLKNEEISSYSQSKLDKFRGEQVGIIFQKDHFVASLTVLENILLAQYLGSGNEDKPFALSLLKRLGIQDLAHKKTITLSQGEKQRASIARALANKPSIILADEPTSALDDHNCTEVINLLKEQCQLVGSTLLIVTHDNRLKALVDDKILLS